MMTPTSWPRKIVPFAVATAVIVGLGLIGCQMWDDFWDPPTQVDLSANSAKEELRNAQIPPNFRFARGRKRPPGFVGTAAYTIRYDGPRESYDTLRSRSIWKSIGDFKEIGCDKAVLPWSSHSLDWIGLACPSGTTVRIARSPDRTPGDSLGLGESALLLAHNDTATQLIFLYAGT